MNVFFHPKNIKNNLTYYYYLSHCCLTLYKIVFYDDWH